MSKEKIINNKESEIISFNIESAKHVIVFMEQEIGTFECDGIKGSIGISPKGMSMRYKDKTYMLTMNNFINPILNSNLCKDEH